MSLIQLLTKQYKQLWYDKRLYTRVRQQCDRLIGLVIFDFTMLPLPITSCLCEVLDWLHYIYSQRRRKQKS